MNEKWEYKYVKLQVGFKSFDPEKILNELGNDGWELVHVSNNFEAYLKRKKL